MTTYALALGLVCFASISSFAASPSTETKTETKSDTISAATPFPSMTPSATATPETSTVMPETYPVKGTPAPTATPVEIIPVAASPSPTATPATTATPKPTATPKLTPAPKGTPLKDASGKEYDPRIQAACKEMYASAYQEKFRLYCMDGATQAMKTGWSNAAAQCRTNRGMSERQRLVCQAGATIGDEVRTSKITYTERASSCRDLFPIVSPVDVYFQESCLSGSDLQAHSRTKATIGNCRWLVPNDRGFLAPCAAGISLTANLINGEKTTASDLNKLCSQYFDKRQFNLGYRSCLNGLSLSLTPDKKEVDVIHRCGEVSSDSAGSERGSCIVGYELYRYLHKQAELSKRFKACGDTKVTYDERDTLACLTASSLTDFMDRGRARKACKEIFTGHKNHSRGACERML